MFDTGTFVLDVEAVVVGGCVQAGDWVLLTENPKAGLAALRRGETDAIVPAASGFIDRFAQFMIELGIPQLLDKFPDHRKRKWIAPFLFCNVMLHKAIFRRISSVLRARLCIGWLFAPMHSRTAKVCVGANSLPTHTFPGELN